MTVRELNRDQLDELKQRYIIDTVENPSWGELADTDSIADEIIFKEYELFVFTNDDFFCSCGK